MESLEHAQREAESKLARQKSDFEHRIKVINLLCIYAQSPCMQTLEDEQRKRDEDERQKTEDMLRTAQLSERQKVRPRT
jgi:hypothetical protein